MKGPMAAMSESYESIEVLYGLTPVADRLALRRAMD